jgi:hypothetical protein
MPGRPGGFGGGGGYRPPMTSFGYRPAAPQYRPSPPPRPPSRGWTPAGTPSPLRWAQAILRPRADSRGRPITGRLVQPVSGYGMKEVRYINGKPVSVAPYKPSPPSPARLSGWRKAGMIISSLLRLGHNVEETLPRVPHVDSAPLRAPAPPPVRPQGTEISGPPRGRGSGK